ncbi:hypothetical protein Tsubulata_021759 [Turnera subulata]|uniref:Methyltransferase n=1 Tax=Turnera subulata TaxID=218843 RepID=A0A9Q0FAF9_9ROSI|nr:hypothetical protein Tsubulata_021759 [Turnera subulata]
MAISVPGILKERKYPFILSLFILLLFATFFFYSNDIYQFPTFSPSDLLRRQIPTATPPPSPPPPPTVVEPPPIIQQPRAVVVNEDNSSNNNNNKYNNAEENSQADSASGGGGETDSSSSGDYGDDANTSTNSNNDTNNNNNNGYQLVDEVSDIKWGACRGSVAVDYIPCLDNYQAIKELKSRRHMEHRERHCPKPSPRCLVPLPYGYKAPVPWPKSRDMIWYNNVPHPKLVDYKKDQNWVIRDNDYFVFPGGGTQFKDGVGNYFQFIEKSLPIIRWGRQTRVVLDVGCGVATFGGYLLDQGVLTMSVAPKDEHEAQIQFALERGIPAFLAVIGTQKLPFSNSAFDVIHCARCRVHWDADGGKPLMELNRILRPGGFFIWSATPVYRKNDRDRNVWNSMVALTKSMCWTTVVKNFDSSGIGLVIYQKPASYLCYDKRQEKKPPLCDPKETNSIPWYTPLSGCLSRLGRSVSWPADWPFRLTSEPPSLPLEERAGLMYDEDTKHWSTVVSDVYLDGKAINWSSIRNIMDMNAGYGGFAAALVDLPYWVMNVVPIHREDTLSIIFDRGLIGVYHDWCESFNTYPRTYDLLHASFLFGNLAQRCEMLDVAVEMDRILRPGGYIVVQDKIENINKLSPILRSLHWSTSLYQGQFLIGKKDFWRPM